MAKKGLGTYVQATLARLDDGAVLKKADELLARAVAAVNERAAAQGGAKGGLTIKLTIADDGKGLATVASAFSLSLPVVSQRTAVKVAGGRLLMNPDGDSLNDKDQMLLPYFDKHGDPAGAVNLKTGEVVDEEEDGAGVVGRVGKAEQA